MLRGAITFGVVVAISPVVTAGAQTLPSGKWVATIPTLTNGGAADLTVELKGDKQSRARITFRNGRSNVQLAWNIAAGNCRDDGPPVAAQAAFNPVQTQMDGGGSATGTFPKLESGKQYYVRVFSPQSLPTDASLFGCANMSEKL